MRRNQKTIPLNECYALLTDFFLRQFGDTSLPSHDLSHHVRVWQNASFLLDLLDSGSFCQIDEEMQLKTMIACMLHDIGMIFDSSENHGRESRRICEIFLNENIGDKCLHHDILFSVENHDNKQYSEVHSPCSIITILSVADDMDAFSYTGIFRYIEIYSRRGIQQSIIPETIISNAEKRLNHMVSVYGFLPELCGKQEYRFNTLKTFLTVIGDNNYNILQELTRIIETGLLNRMSIIETAWSGTRNRDSIISEFFRNTAAELSE